MRNHHSVFVDLTGKKDGRQFVNFPGRSIENQMKATTKEVTNRSTMGMDQICENLSAKRCSVFTNKVEVYKEAERRIQKACDQMDMILSKIQDVELRYQRAVKDGHQCTSNYELQLQVLRGMYNMYYTYCSQKAQILAELEEDLYQ